MNTKKSLIVLSSVVAGIFLLTSFALDYELKPGEYKGEIILKKGTRTGYVDLKGDESTPWAKQQSVRFFSEDALADGKVTRKEKEKFKPKDLLGYKVEDRYFESIKISSSKLITGVGIPGQRFVERLADGNIKVYKLYEAPDPAGVYVGEAEIAAHEKELERMRNEPLIVIQKGEDKYALLEKLSLTELLSDCAEVKDKYLSGGYGAKPFNPDASTKAGKFIANKTNAETFGPMLIEIVNDYNKCTAK